MEIFSGSPFPFGATPQREGINFALYAKYADKLSLSLFTEEDLTHPLHELELDPIYHKTGAVWHILIKGLPPHGAYAYRVYNSETKDQPLHILDPYAKSLVRTSEWVKNTSQQQGHYQLLGKFFSTEDFDWKMMPFPGYQSKIL